ncbi:PREDICTED: proteasome assembly chaperone 2-like [Amphimedon queenslandica]|uniref:Proteasome assembly chaperone 2 n=1 Tax=Amphimedon queenslandica TaxID=400682 RepID=A0A1X7VJF2_AMPQE|nr:PREDICTED: proteasome assembly chaperone 2-like [Amphimedon queenslandica]|eukprot:XP_003384233.1 PREDICTED: proteasome assembly chaperone 2-like [Amphimedon queenslandica]
MADFFIQSNERDQHLPSGYKILLPSVSVGNVPQLTLDLIINSLHAKLSGWFQDDSILPVIGNKPFNHSSPSTLTTPAELYISHANKLMIVQLRSPIAKGKSNKFINRLVEWLEAQRPSAVILLASLYAEERMDVHIQSSPFRFLLNENSVHLFTHFSSALNWQPMEPRNTENKAASPDGVLEIEQIFLPGSGFAKQMYKKSASLPLVTIAVFSSQGNNCPDAINMADHIDQWLNLKGNEEGERNGWSLPASWSSVYGGPSPKSLY